MKNDELLFIRAAEEFYITAGLLSSHNATDISKYQFEQGLRDHREVTKDYMQRFIAERDNVKNLAAAISLESRPRTRALLAYIGMPGPIDAAHLKTLLSEAQAELGTPLPDVKGQQKIEFSAPVEPVKMLLGKEAILSRLDVDETKWRHVVELSRRTGGPIIIESAGGMAKASDLELIPWWNEQHSKGADASRERKPDVHPYGKEGGVVPEIGGGIKKARKPSKS